MKALSTLEATAWAVGGVGGGRSGRPPVSAAADQFDDGVVASEDDSGTTHVVGVGG